ncbi:hypothetical protein SAMN04488515_2109 [Cognatiyoonia koreensis]|uniref:Uncharacterized protein n=1 Tax=Cognatiyoonia koreensis TaxID=364200 RepID=A0A1I0QR81_9RHOB|nr:hypothetical protein [Cognatiyoonia koreensis]SEW29801.1 hypothetical protein SAMN04488515_2109 [Cognatiyoonia koreensis]
MNWSILRWFARQVGLTDGRIFDPAFDGRMAEIQRPAKLPEGRVRIHFFAADFETDAEAELFCFGTGDPNKPEPITTELDGATIDTAFVEVVRGNLAGRLSEFLSGDTVADLMADRRGRNTLIFITEEAFSGLPFQVNDTDTLRYLGAHTVAT